MFLHLKQKQGTAIEGNCQSICDRLSCPQRLQDAEEGVDAVLRATGVHVHQVAMVPWRDDDALNAIFVQIPQAALEQFRTAVHSCFVLSLPIGQSQAAAFSNSTLMSPG